MISLSVLNSKKSFIKTNGDTVVDLIRRSVSFLNQIVEQGTVYVVEDGIQMRCDLISKFFYQTSNYACILMKYNGISNPFAINVGDVFKIPDQSNLGTILQSPDDINGIPDNWKTSTRKKKRKSTIQASTSKDQARINYLSTGSNTLVAPPNIVSKDTSVKVSNGKIIFGADVTSVTKEDCPDPISRTKLQAALLQNKIFS